MHVAARALIHDRQTVIVVFINKTDAVVERVADDERWWRCRGVLTSAMSEPSFWSRGAVDRHPDS